MLNVSISVIEKFVTIVCGIILPRIILTHYGSKYNGLISSITQFMGVSTILRAGLGGATRAALYKPIADNNYAGINSIIKATNIFMRKVSLVFVCFIIVTSILYPIIVKDEFEWFFTFSLFLIISMSSFAESFFGVTYDILLQAEQSVWIYSIFRTAASILRMLITIGLVFMNCSIHLVKAGSTFVNVMQFIIFAVYVKKQFAINLDVKPDFSAISQRWNAFWHQIAQFITYNTDIIVLTFFSSLKEVSVYSVYNMVMQYLYTLCSAFVAGVEAAFGNMIVKKDKNNLQRGISLMEMIMRDVCMIAYSCAGVLIIDFINIYTRGINDVSYKRPLFAILIVCAGYINGVRLPYQTVVYAAGLYKQTMKIAMLEPIINLLISILLAKHYGIVGVAVGTLAASLFGMGFYVLYVSKHLIYRNLFIVLGENGLALFEGVIVFWITNRIIKNSPDSYFYWGLKAILALTISCGVIFGDNYLLRKQDAKDLFQRLRSYVIKV